MTLVWKLNVAWVLKFQGKERSKGGGFGGWLVFVSFNGSMKRENLLYMSFFLNVCLVGVIFLGVFQQTMILELRIVYFISFS